MFEFIEEKEDEGALVVESNDSETPMNATVWEDIKNLPEDGYEVDYGRLT